MSTTITRGGDILRRQPLGEKSLRVWRLVAAHPKGISMQMLVERLRGVLDRLPVKHTLTSLKLTDYVKYVGNGTRWGLWHITGKLPIGEDAPAWFAETCLSDGHDDTDDGAAPAAAPAAAGLPPGAVNSVFSLGAALGAASTDAGQAAPESAAATPAAVPAPAADPAHPSNWQPAAVRQLPAIKPSLGAAVTTQLSGQRREPVFTLDSAGHLTIDDGRYDVVKLDPPCTRALFRWLDRMGGLDLGRLVGEASAA